MTDRGDIKSAAGYLQSKMLDHSSWLKGDRGLPRRITPSDLECPSLSVFDNYGKVIVFELERGDKRQWRHVGDGQRGAYESIINRSPHVAAVCSHNVEVTRKIDTRFDVTAFQLMAVDGAMVSLTNVIEGNHQWQDFVFAWFHSPHAPHDLRRALVTGALKNGRQQRAKFCE